MKWYSITATWFGSGKVSSAPGTIGSLATLPLAYVIHMTIGWQGLLVASMALFTLGCVATRAYLKHEATNSDPKEVVIDEVAGQMLTLTLFVPSLGGYLLGFLLFRIFDVFKPWPISWVDRHVKGAVGVMLDDIIAAIIAICLSIVALLLLHDYDETMRSFIVAPHPMIDAYVPAATHR